MDATIAEHIRLAREGLLNYEESEARGVEVRFPFRQMTKKFGKAYIEYLEASYASFTFSVYFGVYYPLSEWQVRHGGVPDSFVARIREVVGEWWLCQPDPSSPSSYTTFVPGEDDPMKCSKPGAVMVKFKDLWKTGFPGEEGPMVVA